MLEQIIDYAAKHAVEYAPLIGVFADSLDYMVRYPVAQVHRIKEYFSIKKLSKENSEEKKAYEDFLKNRLEKEFRIVVNRYNATRDNIEDIGPIHREENLSLLPLMHVALDNGTLDSYFFLKKKTNVEQAYLFCFGGDKTFNIHHMLKHMPKSVVAVAEKDYSTRPVDFEKLFRSVYRHIESGAGMTSFYIKPIMSGVNGKLKNWKETALTWFQNHEYSLSMNFGKRFLDGCSIASGAFAVYKRSALEKIVTNSSHNVLGEDYENSLHLFSAGEIARHDPSVEIETSMESSTDEMPL
jgi:hypothetical protein